MGSQLILGVLTLIATSVWISVPLQKQELRIIACDVGQGDATLIEKGKDQILIDGGPNDKVLDCLSKYMPYYDREIELVIATHSDKDHIAGLPAVVKNYTVDEIWTNEFENSTQTEGLLEEAVGGSGARVVHPTTGRRTRLGLIYLDVINPDAGLYKSSDNEKSISVILTYQKFEAIFTGDWTPEISKVKKVNYLKVPHHGSKTGLTQELLEILDPDIAVISVGAKNSYGHPTPEILKMLKEKGIPIRRTDLEGDVVFEVPD